MLNKYMQNTPYFTQIHMQDTHKYEEDEEAETEDIWPQTLVSRIWA